MTVETRPFRGTCPAGRNQTKECPMKYLNGFAQETAESCFACLAEWKERAAIMEHDGKLPRAEAERVATEQLKAALRAAEKQRSLF